MMKKLFALGTATVSLGMLLAGCGSTTSANGSAAAKSISASTTTFPQRAITVIVPYPPGGASDIIARIVDKYAPSVFGHHFIFRYDPGAGGALGATDIADSKPDGYTIGTYNFPEVVAQPIVGSGKFQANSFDYLAQLVSDPQIIVTSKGSKYDSLSKLIATAKANPGKVTVAIPGSFDGTEFVLLELEKLANVKFTMITFNGGAPETAAILGHHVDAAMINLSVSKQLESKVNFLAVSSSQPTPLLPGVQTFKQLGYNITFNDGRVFLAPKGLPPAVETKLVDGFKKIYNNPQFQADLAKANLPAGYMSGSQVTNYVSTFSPEAKTLLSEYGLLKK